MRFLAWLRKIQNALHKCAESVRNTEGHKQEKCLPSKEAIEVRAVVSYDENTVIDAKAQAKSEHTTQESVKKATWAAVVAASIYALVAAYQGCEMHKATVATESAAKTADQTLKQSIADRRPYVIARNIGTMKISFAKQIQVNVQLINWGRSLATDVTMDGHVWYGEGTAGTVERYFAEVPLIPKNRDILYLIPNIGEGNDPKSPSFKYSTVDSGNNAPSHKAIQFILHSDDGVIAAGRIWYWDTFGNPYRTDFCFRTLITGAVADCTKHNEIH